MNGEIYLSCALCVALKSALRGNPKLLPQDQKYIKYLNFEFAKEHFRTAEGVSRAAQDGINDASKAAEQKRCVRRSAEQCDGQSRRERQCSGAKAREQQRSGK